MYTMFMLSRSVNLTTTFVICSFRLFMFLGIGIANNMDPDQTAPMEQSDQGSYCVLP